ncbi:MAG TPA: response regulator [Tepidisphaeraceae bacterium]|nr:response regulator [Tepidisphaeraceae bacterium]
MMRVVVVEDDVQLRTVLAVFFRSMGAEVLAQSGDGQDALERLEQDALQPDLILTDCQMPRLDGISMVRQLRQRGDQTPVIMMSGQTDPQVQQLALNAGVNQWLTKPLSVGTLNLAIVQTFRGTAA